MIGALSQVAQSFTAEAQRTQRTQSFAENSGGFPLRGSAFSAPLR